MKNTITLFTILLFSFSASAQLVPCVNGMAGEYPCCGYDLVSQFTLPEMGIVISGSDSWGWTDPLTGIEYAIFCGRNKTAFIELSDPENPIYLGFVPKATSNSLWRDAKVYNNHVFIVSEAGGHGMQVFDLTRLRDVTNPPEEFDMDAYFDDIGHAHNIAINEETGYAYIIGASTYNGGPHFVNIQDPTNPVSEGGYDGDGYTHDAQVIVYDGPDEEHVGKELFFGFNGNSLTIVDVTDKTDPTMISRTTYEISSYTHQGWIDEDHTIVYINDELDERDYGFNTRTLIMDCTDLDSPELIEEYTGVTPATDHNLYVKGDKVYESNYMAGMRVLQINDDPGNRLEEVGYFDVFPEHNENANFGWLGAWNVYPFFESGNIVISSLDEGFFLVRPSIEMSCAVGIEEFEEVSFSIYPNPTSDVLNVIIDAIEKVNTLEIIDLTGRIVYKENIESRSNRQITIDVSALSSGAYSIVIDGRSAQQFVIDK